MSKRGANDLGQLNYGGVRVFLLRRTGNSRKVWGMPLSGDEEKPRISPGQKKLKKSVKKF